MVRQQLFIGFALLAGVAAGYFMRSDNASPQAAPSAAQKTAKGKIADGGEAASVKALRRRIAELERLLAEKRAGDAAVVIPVTNATTVAAAERPRGNPGEWLENLKTTDPERYAQATNRIARWRQNRAERARTAIEFLSSVDTSRMSKSARKTHAALQEMIARREELEQQLHQEGISAEDRGKIFEELRGMHHEMGRLNAEERNNLIAETAKTLGFEGDDVKEITSTIQEVIRATDGGFGGGHHGRHGRRPPPPAR